MADKQIPDLPHNCNSWVIVLKGTVDSVAEVYERSLVERVNFDKYEALTALDYLQKRNKLIVDNNKPGE